MNYRHAYHAGNFADVLKHAVLTLVIEHLKQKPTPFRIVDTHAGIGRYELTGVEASKTLEWQSGIGRLLAADAPTLPPAAAVALAPYLALVRAENPPGRLDRYPGSPRVARLLMRPQDHLQLNELHPDDAQALKRLFGRDRQTTVTALDGWIALKAALPPKERRGVVLIDPPYEEKGEFARIEAAMQGALRRFETGIYLVWYPIKDPVPVARFLRRLEGLAPGRLLVCELMLRKPIDIELLNGTGLAIFNPPYRLDEAIGSLLPLLSERMGDAKTAFWRLQRPGSGGR